MVMTTSKPAPPRPADMTREEAETVTQQIKGNFDSLGNMLLAARDRKAFKVLGYRSFETYCQTEFGKSSSTAYQAIEDVKIRSQLEARISENYGEEVTLKFPSSHLKPLKAVEDIDDKLRAIEYAQKLAASEGKKATKQHLEIAIFEISGKRSEDFRSAIQKLGFAKGVQVETLSPIKKDRGTVTNVDKLGKIYVEHYYGSNKAKDYDATQLRILTNEEKPTNPLEGSIASKGNRVLIYAEGLQGKKGTIYSWKEGKTALVKIDGRDNGSPIIIAYAEMELIRKTEPKNATWESELVWESGKNTYYYFPQEKRITSNLWPTGLTLEPSALDTDLGSPIKFMQHWESKFAGKVLESLANPARTKTLALAQAIELPEAQAKEFASDLIVSLRQLFWDEIPGSPSALLEDNQRLQEQLIEAEAAIQSMVNAASTASTLEAAMHTNFLLENTAEISAPGEAAPHTDFLLENTSAISSPGETAAHTDFLTDFVTENVVTTSEKIELSPKISPEIAEQLESERKKAADRIADNKFKKNHPTATNNKHIKKQREQLDKDTASQHAKLEDLDKFSQFRVGQTICHKRDVLMLGKIINLNFSQGGMPLLWVKYFRDGELEETPTSELVSMVFTVDT